MLSSCHQNLPKMNTVPFKFQCAGVCLNCKISRCFKITAFCLTCIHCLTRDSSFKWRFNSLAAKNLGGSGRKNCYPFGVQWNWNRHGVFCPQSKLHIYTYAEYVYHTQDPYRQGHFTQGMCRCTLEGNFFGLELLKTQEGKGQKFFCSLVNSETRMFAFHTLFLRTT